MFIQTNYHSVVILHKTLSKWIGATYKSITRIRLSCGGCIGGASWFEYVEKLDNIEPNTIVKCRRFDGKEIRINTAFVVDTEDFTLATVQLDVREWKNITREYILPDVETRHFWVDKKLKLIED